MIKYLSSETNYIYDKEKYNIGGKGEKLVELYQLLSRLDDSIEVPFFTILSHSNDEKLDSQSFVKSFKNRLSSDLLQKIQKDFGDNETIAIRSSATIEDLEKQSCAGLFKTILHVKHKDHQLLKESIYQCLDSLLDDQVKHYCKHHQIDAENLKISVVLQRMVKAEWSGIYFSQDPRGGLNHKVLVLAPGIGDKIVENKIDCNHYYLEQNGEIFDQDVSHLVDSAFIQQIICSLMQIESLFLWPVDIEWSYENNFLQILQVRPISTIIDQDYESTLVFDRSNIGENYPGVSSTLTFSTLRYAYYRNFKQLLNYLGVPSSMLSRCDNSLQYLVGQFKGQIYYNLGHWYQLIGLLPVQNKFAQKSFLEMIGGQNKIVNQKSLKRDNISGGIQLTIREKIIVSLIAAPRIVLYIIFLSKIFSKHQKDFNKFKKNWRKSFNEKELNLEVAMKEIHLAEEEFFKIMPYALLNDLLSMVLMKMID